MQLNLAWLPITYENFRELLNLSGVIEGGEDPKSKNGVF
jgi:hypothetical protein